MYGTESLNAQLYVWLHGGSLLFVTMPFSDIYILFFMQLTSLTLLSTRLSSHSKYTSREDCFTNNCSISWATAGGRKEGRKEGKKEEEEGGDIT